MADDDFALLEAAVREAGALAMSHYGTSPASWDKVPGDPVSEADLAVDRLLRRRLLGDRPGYGWLSEESAAVAARPAAPAGASQPTWIVDPIDGTRAFLKHRPEFCVSVALIAGGSRGLDAPAAMSGAPLLACVFNPATDEFFAARRGTGASCNGAPIRVGGRPGLAGASLLASKRTFERHGWLAALPGAAFHHVNSIAYRMALVAAGRFDATVSLSEKSDWDIAAAHLLIAEAGGTVATARGHAFRYGKRPYRHPSVIAATPGVFAPLMALLGGG